MAIEEAKALDFNKPLAVVFVCSERKEDLRKQSELVKAKAEQCGYQVVEEFQALLFPKETSRERVFLDAFRYLFNNRELVQTLFIATENILGEDSMTSALLSLLKQYLSIDVIVAIDEEF